jgi:hypothetical protein
MSKKQQQAMILIEELVDGDKKRDWRSFVTVGMAEQLSSQVQGAV